MNEVTPIYMSEDEVFWGELAPTEHFVFMYENDGAFFDLLERFVTAGFNSGDAVIIIATKEHRRTLNERLERNGLDLEAARQEMRYMDLSAENCLATFMKDGWPDQKRFEEVVGNLIEQVRFPGRRVRAFGEMVAMLWAEGHAGATVRLEHLWNEFRVKQAFPLFCAYPKSGFTTESNESLEAICAAHTVVINGSTTQKRKATA